MFSSKTAGNLYKTAKILTCAVLAVCIVSSMLLTLPFITAADTELKENTTAAIFIGKANQSRIANAFIPVDIAGESGNLYSGKTYFKLEFKCKMFSGTKPIIGVMRVKNDSEDGTNKTFSEPSWCDNASDVTVENGICTAYFSVDFNGRYDNSSRGNRSFYITVGNAEHNGGSASEKDYGVSFIMSDVTLVTCDASHKVTDNKNRLPQFTPESIDFSGTYFLRENGYKKFDNPAYARAMVWGVDSSPNLVKKVVVPIGYNTLADYDPANFTLHAATDTLREYYTNDKYSGMYFEKLANSDDKGFAIISDDLNKKFVFINANHKGEEDNTTVDGYKPQYNKVGNIFIPLSLGQYFINEGALTNQKVLVKVTFNAVRIEGDGPPVLGRVLGKDGAANGMDSWAWGLSTINARYSAYYTSYNRSDNGGGVRPQCTYNAETGEFVGWVGFETANYQTLFGKSEVLTIGNAEHVYQEGTFDSTSFNSAFAISDIKVDLYSTTISGNNISPNALIAEDITPALTADSIDTEGDWYFNYKNGASNHDKDLIRASQNVWHIDGEKSLVSFVNTEDKGGYARKYSVTESGATGTLSTYIKLDAGKTYQYIFKNKYESGERAKPFVEFITASGTEKLSTGNYNTNINGYNNTVFAFKTPADLNADKNVRIGIEFPSAAVSGTFGGFELYEIGDDGMAKTDKNLMLTVFIGKNEVISPYSADAKKGVWMKEGTLQEGGTTFEITYKEDNYYLLSSAPKMLFFAGSQGEPDTPDAQYKGGDGKLKQSVAIEKNTKYRFSANVKYIDTGEEGDTVGFKLVTLKTNGSERPLENYTDLSDENKYLLKYEFTSPKSLLSGKNFSATFNVPNSYVSGYLTNVCLQKIDDAGNVLSDNLFVNGDFSSGDDTGWTRSGSFYKYKFYDIPENFFSKNPSHNIHALQYRDTSDYALLQQMLQVKASTSYELQYTTLVTGLSVGSGEPYGVLYQKLWADEEHSDSSWTHMLDSEKNPDAEDVIVITTKETLNAKALGENFDESDIVNQAIRYTKRFTTSDMLRLTADNNLSVRYNFMTGVSGYISDYALYEIESTGNISIRVNSDYLKKLNSGEHSISLIDKNGNKTNGTFLIKNDHTASDYTASFDGLKLSAVEIDGETVENGSYSAFDYYKRISGNLMLDGDFAISYGTLNYTTPWQYGADGIVTNIELEKGFFENYSTPTKMIRSDGSAANQTYGNRLSVDPNARYYFSGYYVKTNFVGVTPEIFYRSVRAGGEYVALPFEEYFNASRYYFETEGGFTIPDDALLDANGKADIIVQINNRDHGKGYFCGLTLTKDGYSENLFKDSNATLGGFLLKDYDPEIFVPFEGDEGFEDGNWSGEKTYTVETGAIDGTVLDDEGYTYPGITMKLTPGNLKVVTDGNGVYNFENLKPGKYSLYLVESSGNEIFCTDITVKPGVRTTLPDLYYSENLDGDFDSGEIDFDDGEDIREQKYGALKGYCYDSSGKLLSGIDIYVDSKSHHTKTDSKGIFVFDKVPAGVHKICTVLQDGSVYVFRTVKIEAGKGTIVKVMIPDEGGLATWLIVALIAGGAAVLIAAGIVCTAIIIKKKKNRAVSK